MRLMITGTSGFVGGALGVYARRQGHHVTGLSRGGPRPGSADTALRHDLSRPVAWDGPLDAVIHAAALSAPWGKPAAFDAANVAGTRHALDVAHRAGARFVLISSSSVLYAPGDQFELPEDPAPETVPVNDYARTKRQAEGLVRDSGLSWTILRPRAVFGVGDTVLFPRIARAARLRVLPRFVQTPPAVGDLVSIDNLVRRTMAAVERGADGILHLVDAEPVEISAFVTRALDRVGLPGPSFALQPQTARRIARSLERLSARTGWWEPPLTRFGVDVFTQSKTFDDSRARAALGAPDVPTDMALTRFVEWWRRGADLSDPAIACIGADP